MIPLLVIGKMYRTRKRKEVEERKVNDGETLDNFFTDEMREEMETMWEVIKIIHILLDSLLYKKMTYITFLDTTNFPFSLFNEGIS